MIYLIYNVILGLLLFGMGTFFHFMERDDWNPVVLFLYAGFGATLTLVIQNIIELVF